MISDRFSITDTTYRLSPILTVNRAVEKLLFEGDHHGV